jgi:hypothetical protein
MLSCALAAAAASGLRSEEIKTYTVNYITADAVYVNAGRFAGLAIGATVDVVRGGRKIAVLAVVHISSHSASCRIVEQTESPKVGDKVAFTPGEAPMAAKYGTRPDTAYVALPAVTEKKNVVRGDVSVESMWRQDLTGSSLSSLQPAVFARVTVGNIGGIGATFRLRQRSRLTLRREWPGSPLATREWSNRLTELALVFDRPGATVEWGVGRFITPYMRGVGIIDGGYVAARVHPMFRVGAAGGAQPDPTDLGFRSDSPKIAGFVNFEYSSDPRWRLSSTAALSSSHIDKKIDREFCYLQNVLSLSRRMTLYQSVEIDINRDWREEAAGGERFEFSNFYLAANLTLSDIASLDFTYDARQNVRDYYTMEVPDSLFDDRVYNGWGGGVSFRLPYQVTIRGAGGIRYREDDFRTNRYFSILANAARFPYRGHSIFARFSYAETPLTTGYRPVLTYRFPVGRRLRMNVSGGGYIYRLGTITTDSYYGECSANYTFGRYFTSAAYRQYFGGDLDSIDLYAEIGLRL